MDGEGDRVSTSGGALLKDRGQRQTVWDVLAELVFCRVFGPLIKLVIDEDEVRLLEINRLDFAGRAYLEALRECVWELIQHELLARGGIIDDEYAGGTFPCHGEPQLENVIWMAVLNPFDGSTKWMLAPYGCSIFRVMVSPSPIPWPRSASTSVVLDSNGRNHRSAMARSTVSPVFSTRTISPILSFRAVARIRPFALRP